MKHVTILSTKYSDWMSKFIYLVTGRGYTHSSIALGDAQEEYYSFNYRGFAVETMEKHKKRGVRHSCSCKLQISDEAFEKLEKAIEEFRLHREEYSYSQMGVFCCVLGLPIRFNKQYFCSQFVAEILGESGVLKLKKQPCCYTPNQLLMLLKNHPDCVRVVQNVI